MSLLGLIVISLALGVLSWLAFVWSVKSGQYDDPEGPKYRMLDDDDDEAPAARPAPPVAAPPAGSDDPPPAPASGAPGAQPPDRS